MGLCDANDTSAPARVSLLAAAGEGFGKLNARFPRGGGKSSTITADPTRPLLFCAYAATTCPLHIVLQHVRTRQSKALSLKATGRKDTLGGKSRRLPCRMRIARATPPFGDTDTAVWDSFKPRFFPPVTPCFRGTRGCRSTNRA